MAKLEIAIEGPHGWASSLPTWKLPRNHWVSKLFFGGRPATGYHVWVNLFVLILLHFVFVFQAPTLKVELKLLSFFVLFWTIEDFLWFVLNPAYGLKNFRKEKIWWHADNWFKIAPREYFIFVPLAIILYWFSL
jgi:hypothetical protein